ncbi:MAG TPA: ABC transporter permease subunit, partial [Candidatus Bipolaricaulota bacterium]
MDATRSTPSTPLNRPRSGPGAPLFLGLPALLAAGAVCLPALYLLVRTLELGEAAWAFLSSARNLQILWNSAMLVASVTASSVALAVPLAWLTVRADLPLRRFWSAVTPLPLVIPSYVGAYLFVLFLGEKGTLQGWLQGLGVERLPGIYGFFGAWLVLSLLCFPYVLLSLRAALWRMDPGLEESARSLGHCALETFFRVTLPLLRPALLAGALLVALYTLSDFGAVSVLNYKTFTWAIYLQYGTINRALAAALSTVLVACTVLLLLAERRARGRTTYYRSGTGAGAPPKPVALGRWRWPAFAFCALVTLLSLGVPLGVLLQWFLKGIAAGEGIQGLVPATLNSLTAS